MTNTKAFEAGKMYSTYWKIVAADGYEFTKETEVTVNGSTSILDMSTTNIVSGSENKVFNIWTTPKEAVPGNAINEITIADLVFPPVIGKTAGESDYCSLPVGANYTVAIVSWNIVREDGGVTELSDSDVFEAGKDYAFCVLLHAKTGYEFWKDTTVTINGSSDIVDMEYTEMDSEHSTAYWVWTLPVKAVNNNVIDTITITNAYVTPVIGKTAGECLDYELPENANYTINLHYWYCDTDSDDMYEDSVFEESKEYSLTWSFIAAEGYCFTEDTEVTINGSSDIVDTEYTGIDEADSTRFKVWTSPIETSKAINSIAISNTNFPPKAGNTVGESYSGEIPDDANYTITGTYWVEVNEDGSSVDMSDDDLLETDKQYSAGWKFNAESGYEFLENTTVTINGSSYLVDSEWTEIDDEYRTVFWVWTLPMEAVQGNLIDAITITNADVTPIIGKTAAECYAYELPEGANYTATDHYWYCDTDGEDMSDTDVFMEGKEYSLGWAFVTADGYGFSKDVVITINGRSDIVDMDVTYVSDDSLRSFVWTLPTEAVEGSEFELGDVNMDGVINTGDAVIILRQNVGLVTFTNEQEILADYNKDGKVNTGDAVAVLRYCVS